MKKIIKRFVEFKLPNTCHRSITHLTGSSEIIETDREIDGSNEQENEEDKEMGSNGRRNRYKARANTNKA